jgi:hypothetical protein
MDEGKGEKGETKNRIEVSISKFPSDHRGS